MSREAAAEPIAADMDDPTLIAGMEDALDEHVDADLADDEGTDEGTDEGAGEPIDDGEDAGEDGEGDEDFDEDEGEDGDEDEDEDEDEGDEEGDAAAGKTAASDAAPITREDGAQWNAEAKRWQKDGQFVAGAAPAAPAGTAGAAATDTAAAGWVPFGITVDRANVAIPEAQVSRVNGHVILGIKDDQFPEFQRRLVKGVVAERSWRQLNDGLRQLEEEKRLAKERPAVRSDSEVEADILMELMKPSLAKLLVEDEVTGQMVPFLDPKSLENLDLKVKLAQRDEQGKIATWEATRQRDATEAQSGEQRVLEGIAETIVEIVEDPQYAAEFRDLSEDDLKAVMQDLRGISRAVFWKEGTEWLRNTQLVFDRLKARATARATSTTSTTNGTNGSSSTTPPAGGRATDATPSRARTDGTTATGAERTPDRAARFNKGQNTAARPTTTSLKAGRSATARSGSRAGSGSTRPSGAEPGHHRRHRGSTGEQDTRTKAQRAEDAARRTTRRYLASPTLDIPDDDDE